MAKKLLDLNCFISFSGIITFKKSENFLKCLSISNENITLNNFNKKLDFGLEITSPGILFKKII